ncbi:MAG: hypothetical protein HYU02_02280 [Thaumarchaeota archaeon]|nr:hypothetical protein [Nitrososphaerota archaeon]
MAKALALIERSLSFLNSQPSNAALPSEASIWEAYRNVEYAIALLKLEYAGEVGFDVKEKKTARTSQPTLVEISAALTTVSELASSGKLMEAIAKARNARNALAEMLYAFRKARAKK